MRMKPSSWMRSASLWHSDQAAQFIRRRKSFYTHRHLGGRSVDKQCVQAAIPNVLVVTKFSRECERLELRPFFSVVRVNSGPLVLAMHAFTFSHSGVVFNRPTATPTAERIAHLTML